MAIGVQHQHPGTVGERHAIDAVLPVQLHQLPLHQGHRLGIVDEGLVFQLQMTPLLVTRLLGDAGEVGGGEVEVEEAKLLAHQPLGPVVIRHDAHLAGTTMATGAVQPLGLLAPLQVDADGVVARLVVAGLIVAVAPARHPEPGLQPAGVLQSGTGAHQGIKDPRLSCLLHGMLHACVPLPPLSCRHLIAPHGQRLRLR